MKYGRKLKGRFRMHPPLLSTNKFDMKQHSFASTLRQLKVNIFYSFSCSIGLSPLQWKNSRRTNITNYVHVFSVYFSGLLWHNARSIFRQPIFLWQKSVTNGNHCIAVSTSSSVYYIECLCYFQTGKQI